MSPRKAFLAPRIFDGETWHERSALLVADGHVEGIIAADSPTDAERVIVEAEMLVPGFVDLQVNGGGGALLNETPTVEAIRTICSAFARFGTTALMPTQITAPPEDNDTAIAAAAAAGEAGVPGFLGLHIEGPHFALARKGAHNPALIRDMNDEDVARLVAARARLPNLLVTGAAEAISPEQIEKLVAAGIVVSIGHSDATYAQVEAAVKAGATMVTHLFNAQSQMGNREPGIVGAALDIGSLSAGLIADGIHVHAASLGNALRAKRGPGHIFLVTDAMSPTGTDWTDFVLTGQKVFRKDGALRLADGTLAGADLTMIDAIRYVHRTIGVPLDEVLRMATLYPAEALGVAETHGHLKRGARADFVALGTDLDIASTHIGGDAVFTAA
ncbi:N-acetylglucosamine-6-phosphate deacetylase [Devosia sp.]|uniref:N-acetylglucosamine-6-phosphate deacetylase n=1 Tax=Devosia sp. TaxID=1871048 RepID=UPI003A9016D3